MKASPYPCSYGLSSIKLALVPVPYAEPYSEPSLYFVEQNCMHNDSIFPLHKKFNKQFYIYLKNAWVLYWDVAQGALNPMHQFRCLLQCPCHLAVSSSTKVHIQTATSYNRPFNSVNCLSRLRLNETNIDF